MNSSQFKRYLQGLGATFESGRGGRLIVRLKGRTSVLPMHGIKKDLGLKE